MAESVWLSPLTGCDLCAAPFTEVMYDAAIPALSTWGNLCPKCFTTHNCQLGTGRGQRYELTERDIGKVWLKTEG